MSSIKEMLQKVKEYVERYYTILLILVVASIAFGLGRLSAEEERHTSIKVTNPAVSGVSSAESVSQTGAVVLSGASSVGAPSESDAHSDLMPSGEVIGSKSGKKYYFPWCGTIKRVKPENQVHFASIAEAKAAGYVAGGNCKGLK